MAVERTELEWAYSPPAFFEAPYARTGAEYSLEIDDGRVVAVLNVAEDPVRPDLESRIAAHVEGLLNVRRLQTHRAFTLSGPNIRQFEDGHMNVAIRIQCSACVAVAGSVDIIQRDPEGNVVRDTRAERIAEHEAMLDAVTPKLGQSPVLDSLLESYGRSVDDPRNELVHLYEVRDALSEHFGGQAKAQSALGIPSPEWGRVGRLANKEPVEQGRHRGKHPVSRRPATSQELDEVRATVRAWIVAFANQVTPLS